MKYEEIFSKPKGGNMEKLELIAPHHWDKNQQVVAACEAPHSCADPMCPGDRNRRKLEAAEEMASALKTSHLVLIEIASGITTYRDIDTAIHRNQAALTQWEKAGKGG